MVFMTCFRASFVPFCPLCWPPPLPPLFSVPFRPFLPLEKCSVSVEKRVQSRAWRGAAPGGTSPQSSGRKFLPEICVKKGQISVRKSPQNVEKIARFPGRENKRRILSRLWLSRLLWYRFHCSPKEPLTSTTAEDGICPASEAVLVVIRSGGQRSDFESSLSDGAVLAARSLTAGKYHLTKKKTQGRNP